MAQSNEFQERIEGENQLLQLLTTSCKCFLCLFLLLLLPRKCSALLVGAVGKEQSIHVECVCKRGVLFTEQVNPVAEDEGESSDDSIEVVHSYRHNTPTTSPTTHLLSRCVLTQLVCVLHCLMDMVCVKPTLQLFTFSCEEVFT